MVIKSINIAAHCAGAVAHAQQLFQGGFMTQNRRSKKQLTILVPMLMAALSACGGGKGTAAAPAPTDQEKIAQLEASGALPRLERLPILEGMDVNANGVRDDIESHIRRKYADPAQRGAAMQTARVFQAALLVDKSNAVALERVAEMGERALNCRVSVFPGLEGVKAWSEMSHELEAITANTKERLLAYLAYNKARSGSVSLPSTGDACER